MKTKKVLCAFIMIIVITIAMNASAVKNPLLSKEETYSGTFLPSQDFNCSQWLKNDDNRALFSVLAYYDAILNYVNNDEVAQYINYIMAQAIINGTLETGYSPDKTSVIAAYLGDEEQLCIEYTPATNKCKIYTRGVYDDAIEEPYLMDMNVFSEWLLKLNKMIGA